MLHAFRPRLLLQNQLYNPLREASTHTLTTSCVWLCECGTLGRVQSNIEALDECVGWMFYQHMRVEFARVFKWWQLASQMEWKRDFLWISSLKWDESAHIEAADMHGRLRRARECENNWIGGFFNLKFFFSRLSFYSDVN